MSDKELSGLLRRLATANAKYKELLEEAEQEITERYGVSPSDVDNDEWIDAYHVGTGRMSLQEVDQSMKMYKKINL